MNKIIILLLLTIALVHTQKQQFLQPTQETTQLARDDQCSQLKQGSDCKDQSGCNWCVTVDFEFCTSAQTCKEQQLLQLFGENNVYTDDAFYERLQHFKDDGVKNLPANNTVDLAMIADGSCRMITNEWNPYTFWHAYHDKVDTVIDAIKNLPDSSMKNLFVQMAKATLEEACGVYSQNREQSNELGFYDSQQVRNSFNNWYNAMCHSTATSGCTQPQQRSLTAGYMCIVACDAMGKNGSNHDMFAQQLKSFALNSQSASQAQSDVCNALPRETDFSKMSFPEFVISIQKLVDVCQCKA